MRRFREIIEDIKAPSPQSLWLDKGELKFFGVKGWTSMVGGRDEDRQELEEKVDSFDKEMGTANNDIKKLQSSKLTCLQLQSGFNYKLICLLESKFVKYQKDYLN